MSSENDGIGGEEWIGEKVETWWGTTSQWKTGQVVEYKALRDEYKARFCFISFVSFFYLSSANKIPGKIRREGKRGALGTIGFAVSF